MIDRYANQKVFTFPKRVEEDQWRSGSINYDQQIPIWDMGVNDQWNGTIFYINRNLNSCNRKINQVKARESIALRLLVGIHHLEETI